ncbi:antitoxin family protein [Nostoc sp. JL33]|nr:antitoxin family protein [Nostoc sp. JL33]MBN3873063.1 antitoxin family protein [Nostoc sp. JL33]
MPKSQTIEAIYEDGVLRPLQTLTGVAEHSFSFNHN